MIRALVIAALCTIGLGAAVAQPTQTSEMKFACDYLEIDCTGIERPSVIVTKLMGAFGVYGAYYGGEKTVFLDPDAPDHTYIHELTHYLLWEVSNGAVKGCASEEAARRVHHAWEGTEYDDSWRGRYGCQAPAESE